MISGALTIVVGTIFWLMIGFTAFEAGSTGRMICILLAIGCVVGGIHLIVKSQHMAISF
jgi:hypothetical protein